MQDCLYYHTYFQMQKICGDKDWIFWCLATHPRHLASGHEMKVVRYVCVMRSQFSIGSLYLFGEDWRGRHTYTCLKGIGLRPQTLISIVHSIVNTIGKTYVSRLRNQ